MNEMGGGTRYDHLLRIVIVGNILFLFLLLILFFFLENALVNSVVKYIYIESW
jgi:hypothetical protein